jgi:hypothetical protein
MDYSSEMGSPFFACSETAVWYDEENIFEK